MVLPRRGWVGWIEQNPLASVLLAICLILSLTGLTVVAKRTAPLGPRVSARQTQGPGGDGRVPGPTPTGSDGRPLPSGAPSLTPSGLPTTPGVTPTATSTGGSSVCRPRQPVTASGDPETGITDTEIKIGQIVTDSSNLPQQLRPNYEGLSAYVRLVNAAGGVCGRRLAIDYTNDQANPSSHDYEQMAQRVFAFVANSSLLDFLDYGTSPPFSPVARDEATGEFVPDIGGLAYSYNRSQSPWHAGVIGSVSPVLVGGGQYRFFVNEAKVKGRACTTAGVLYLVEPTQASQDQAELARVALEQSWGANLGSGNARLYQANLAQPTEVYRAIVQRMVSEDVNCVFTFADTQSNTNFVKAMNQEGVWPPADCARANSSEDGFQVAYVPFASYDPQFVKDAGPAARCVSSFLPHAPLNETSSPNLAKYISAVKALRNQPGFSTAEPSTFSLLGYASGVMFVDAVRACGDAPTRACVMNHTRKLKGFTGGGLLGPVTPFRTTRVTYNAPNRPYGTYDFKWIFVSTVAVRVLGNEANLLERFHRVNPPGAGYFTDTLRVARGTPA